MSALEITPDTYFSENPQQQRTFVGAPVQVRETGEGERIVEGIGVPFDRVVHLGWFKESFRSDCEFVGIERAKVKSEHRETVGVVKDPARVDGGMFIRAHISKTAKGDESYTLARDGAYDGFSIGFVPLAWEVNEKRDEIAYTRVKVLEFSLTGTPAYDDAIVLNVRSATSPHPARKDSTMTDAVLTREQVETMLTTQREDMTREHETMLAQFRDQLNATSSTRTLGAEYRSIAEFVKAVAKGDEKALAFHREFTGGVFDDTATPATWIADAIKLVAERRRQINSFSQSVLPPEGMVLEYLKLAGNSIVVAEQEDEGDDLEFGKIDLDSATAPVKTYGGYTTLSRQAIERAPLTYLNTAFAAMDIAYAKTTEAQFKALLYATVTAQITAENNVELDDAADVFAWLDLIVDAAEVADERGFVLAGLKVSKDVFKQIYRIADTNGDPLMLVTGQGVNRVGTLRAGELSADLANIPVSLVQGAPSGFATFYDPVAITTWEQPGAPLQLQDENIINLSKDFSKYGYAAFASQFPTALVPVTGLGTESP